MPGSVALNGEKQQIVACEEFWNKRTCHEEEETSSRREKEGLLKTDRRPPVMPNVFWSRWARTH
jgi:hypothetical protein